MPVFWLSISVLPAAGWSWSSVVAVFAVLHLILYPASNGYNSLIDQDTEPVGGIKNPPPVTVHLRILVLIFDLLSIGLSFWIGLYFGFCVSVYWLVSKAYSSPSMRLKKMPLVSWLVVCVFQGGWSVYMIWCGILGNDAILDTGSIWLWPVIATLFLAGSYPMTQIYQHESDTKRGDRTLSVLLGIKGTFLFSFAFIFLGAGLLIMTFIQSGEPEAILILLASTGPSFYYFFTWAKKVWSDVRFADFEHTMRFNTVSSLGLSLGFILWTCLKFFSISLDLHP
jgi:1,4-dihydroxy-2-naphthoate octaprenyltransferase